MGRNRGTVVRLSRWAIGLLVPLATVASVQPAQATTGSYQVLSGVSTKGVTLFSLPAIGHTQNDFSMSVATAEGDTVPLVLRINKTVKFYNLIVSFADTSTMLTRLKAIQTKIPAATKLAAVVLTVRDKATNACVDKLKYTPAWPVKYSFPFYNTGGVATVKVTWVYEYMTPVSC